MFPTKSLCLARSPKRSVTTPLSNTATRVSSRATVIAISTPILTPSVQQNLRTDVRVERGRTQVPMSLKSSSIRRSAQSTQLLAAPQWAAAHSIKQTQSPPFYVQQQSKGGHGHDGGAAAVTHQRKRDADDREHAGGHADVHDDTKTQHRNDADRQESAQLVLRARRNFQRQPDQRDEQEKQDKHPEKSPFFRKYRKHEIRMPFREKFQLALCAAVQPFAGQFSGADGDPGLQRVIALSTRVIVRVDEGHDALALVVMQRTPHDLPREGKEHQGKQ